MAAGRHSLHHLFGRRQVVDYVRAQSRADFRSAVLYQRLHLVHAVLGQANMRIRTGVDDSQVITTID